MRLPNSYKNLSVERDTDGCNQRLQIQSQHRFMPMHYLQKLCGNRDTFATVKLGQAYQNIRCVGDHASTMKTSILPIDARKIGKLSVVSSPDDLLDDFEIELDEQSEDGQNLRLAAEQLKSSDIPVSFPTETVYGLGADATRSAAVLGIFEAKQRPADNPLIVHFASLAQLRAVLRPHALQSNKHTLYGTENDPIPAIYRSLIKKFWPGPLTIILPNPPNSGLAPEVTAGLKTFGARMPRNVLALALIKLADVPIAAPSANASTKPSPTAAEHVAYDLDGRIETIIDGGPCNVGVESTVVDGLSDPPLILRPGGISIEQLRDSPGWEGTKIGYKNTSETESQPKAPGMKYRHYSPKAKVILFEHGASPPGSDELLRYIGDHRKTGIVCTRQWAVTDTERIELFDVRGGQELGSSKRASEDKMQAPTEFAGLLQQVELDHQPKNLIQRHWLPSENSTVEVLAIVLGPQVSAIARGIFAALRELDREGVDAILVEGISDDEGDTAAAVMNRLRKAAEGKVIRCKEDS